MICDVSSASIEELKAAKAFAMGCPAMGAEVLEEGEMEPFVAEVESFASGKKIGLFGSYGWGDGQWMRDWEDRMKAAGAELIGREGVICQETPDEDALAPAGPLEKSWRPPAAKKYLRPKKYPRLKKDLRLEIGLYLEEHLQKPAADKPVLRVGRPFPAGFKDSISAIRPESKSCCRIRLQLRVVMLSHWEKGRRGHDGFLHPSGTARRSLTGCFR